ncbi:MAG: Holliday junction branch migration DNA helicase RuvB [Acidobacteria bacterium]|nr:Holliday junction branch migration DNA helicase RuvB [Acidobacteriota bacterium]
MREQGIASADRQEADQQFEAALRPRRLDDFTGQPKLKENLAIAIAAARRRGEAMDHVLLFGPPGLGKTTLAHIIAAELGVDIDLTSGPVIQKKLDLTGMLSNVRDKQVFFVDEIHRLLPDVEEMFYSALEDFRVDIIVGQGPGARTHSLPIPRFTAIGATTRMGMISAPMRGRFGLLLRLNHYGVAELQKIVARSASLLNITVDPAGAEEIARRARGTPRIANRLLRRVRDYAEVRGHGSIDHDTAREGLKVFGVDAKGLDKVDRAILQALCERFGGGPCGLSTLAISVGEPTETVEDVYEPFLIQQGLLMRTPRGRVATPAAWQHLGLLVPPSAPFNTATNDAPSLFS